MKEITYKTRDLYEAALHYASYSNSFAGLEPDGRAFLFVFENKDCTKIAENYFTGKALVNAKTYSDAIRTLKDLIFNRLRAEQGQRLW